MPEVVEEGQAGLYPKEARIIRSAIKKCQKIHQYCFAQGNTPFSPTRLLDVRTPTIRLINSHDLKASDGGYAALSYCWGSTMPESGKTTPETLDARRRGIEFALLPKTLREAIVVTRSLKIPFLWVDALCIIQGDVVDWEKESVTMAQVYSKAVITIAAGMWDHWEGGLFNPEKVKVKLLDRLRVWKTKEEKEKDYSDVDSCVNDNPLSRRGWTLQERELSTRTIHFTSRYIIWECLHEYGCYHIKSRHRPRPFVLRPTYRLDFYIGKCLGIGKYFMSNAWDRHTLWVTIVEDYSRRTFTHPTDKLIALSSLADALEPLMESEYLAGLWRSYLLIDLLWHRLERNEIHPPFSAYYAPSWSWVSTNFVVYCAGPAHPTRPYFSSRKEDVIKTAEITETHMVFDGPRLLPGSFIRLHSLVKSLGETGAEDMELYFDYDDQIFGNHEVDTNRLDNTTTKRAAPRTISNYKICSLLQMSHDGPNNLFAGLILQSAEEGSNKYKRVGMVRKIPVEWLEGLELSEIVII